MVRKADPLSVGLRIGRLEILEYLGRQAWAKAGVTNRTTQVYLCKCDCGAVIKIRRGRLADKCASQSCGCLRRLVIAENRKALRTHGKSRQPEHRAWMSMRARCRNPTNKLFRNYGARGITVCERWQLSFENFLADVGVRPSPKHSLDRINNNGNYEPGNVRWATAKEQTRNTRTNRMITISGQTRCMSEWAEVAGLPIGTIATRFYNGWAVEEIIQPKRKKNQYA